MQQFLVEYEDSQFQVIIQDELLDEDSTIKQVNAATFVHVAGKVMSLNKCNNDFKKAVKEQIKKQLRLKNKASILPDNF